MRSLFTSAVAEAAIRRTGRGLVPRMEEEVRAVGRSFGEHSVGGKP
jgi:hypothetical protein